MLKTPRSHSSYAKVSECAAPAFHTPYAWKEIPNVENSSRSAHTMLRFA